jgi:excisionase family DNA binding protein
MVEAEKKSEVMTVEELSTLFSVPVRTIVRMAKEGKIPSLKIGGKWRFERETISRWMKESSARKKKGRILLIEDDNGDRQAMRRSLERYNVAVVEAVTVEEGIERIGSGKFDCVMLDLLFPDGRKQGMDFLEWLDKNGVDVPVIIYTGYGDAEEVAGALKHGGFFILSKPVAREHLQKAMETVFKFGERET